MSLPAPTLEWAKQRGSAQGTPNSCESQAEHDKLQPCLSEERQVLGLRFTGARRAGAGGPKGPLLSLAGLVSPSMLLLLWSAGHLLLALPLWAGWVHWEEEL